jgi:hypothetical protein
MLRRTGRHAELVIACALFTLTGVWLLAVCRCLPQLALLLVKTCMLVDRGCDSIGRQHMLGRGMERLVRASPAQLRWFLSAVSRAPSRLVADCWPMPRFILTGTNRDLSWLLADKLCSARWPHTLCQQLFRGACCARTCVST